MRHTVRAYCPDIYTVPNYFPFHFFATHFAIPFVTIDFLVQGVPLVRDFFSMKYPGEVNLKFMFN